MFKPRRVFVDKCFNEHADPMNDMQLYLYPHYYNAKDVCSNTVFSTQVEQQVEQQVQQQV